MIGRAAGILIPLFSLRSRNDHGRGDIQSLAPMIDLAVSMGCRIIQLLPLDETAPGEASPYSAMSVMAIDPIYAGTRGLEGIGRVRIARAQEKIGRGRTPDAELIRSERSALLDRAFDVARTRGSLAVDSDCDRFARDNAEWLDDYAIFRALKDRFAWRQWETWPPQLASRDAGALETARRELANAIAKYKFWQFIIHRQWKEAREYARARGVALGGDLAFSPARDSAEVWANQKEFLLDRSVGAPPDDFNRNGQRWGLPLPNWWVMGLSGYRFLRMRVRRAAAMYDLIRIDHLVGLFRTFHFGANPDEPGRFSPEHEDEQRRQGESVLGAIKEEARDAQVVAEDLGTIPPFVRESMRAKNIPGYKVMMWEKSESGERYFSPSEYPELALATTGTHDTEPLTIWWRAQTKSERVKFVRALGLDSAIASRPMLESSVRFEIFRALFASPARFVVIPMQDYFGWSARINRPGTIGGYNWKWRLPLPLGAMATSRAIRAEASRTLEIAVATNRV